jgi:hypothetical protein
MSPQIKLPITVVEKIFAMMRVLEGNDASLACVMPEIVDLSSYLECHAHSPGSTEASNIYLDVIAIIRRKCLWTVNSVSHIADVLVPIGRILAETSSDEQ